MSKHLREDPHTDYKDNWIEDRIMYAAECMHAGYSEEEVINRLNASVPEEMLSLILIAAGFMYRDEAVEGD